MDPPPPALRLVRGLGIRRREVLSSRDAVARALLQAAADMLRRRLSTERASYIGALVEEVLWLFDKSAANPVFAQVLARKLDELERLARAGVAAEAAARR